MDEEDHSHGMGFISEDGIQELFEKRSKSTRIAGDQPKKNFSEWYKAKNDHDFTVGHMQTIGQSKFSCDSLTDEWFRWFLTIPTTENAMTNPDNAYGNRNMALMDREGARVYFAAASPFREPWDFKRIVLTKRAPLLVPAYNMVASVQEYPFVVNGAKDKAVALSEIVSKDIDGIRDDTVEAYFDEEPFYGCIVIRNQLVTISNMPDNNVLGVPQDRLEENGHTLEFVHAGLWMLINEATLKPGDHLLRFKAHSKNYEVQAKFLIKVQY